MKRVEDAYKSMHRLVVGGGPESKMDRLTVAVLVLAEMTDNAGQLHSASMTEMCKSVEHVGREIAHELFEG